MLQFDFSFDSIRIDDKKQLSDCISYHISYYLEDGTISVKERKRDESFDFCPYLIKRVRVPKYSKRLINSLIIAEEDSFSVEKHENDYIQPTDFVVGKEVNLLGHRFLICDCDARTRKYYQEILKVQQDERVIIEKIRSITIKKVCKIDSIIIICWFNIFVQIHVVFYVFLFSMIFSF